MHPTLTPRRVTRPRIGPRMYEYRELRSGYPISEWDLAFLYGDAPRIGLEGYAPLVLSGLWAVVPDRRTPDKFEVVDRLSLHESWVGMPQGRGRPCAFLAFPYETLRSWRQGWFEGTYLVRDIRELAGVSEPAALRFIHGEMLWWV